MMETWRCRGWSRSSWKLDRGQGWPPRSLKTDSSCSDPKHSWTHFWLRVPYNILNSDFTSWYVTKQRLSGCTGVRSPCVVRNVWQQWHCGSGCSDVVSRFDYFFFLRCCSWFSIYHLADTSEESWGSILTKPPILTYHWFDVTPILTNHLFWRTTYFDVPPILTFYLTFRLLR